MPHGGPHPEDPITGAMVAAQDITRVSPGPGVDPVEAITQVLGRDFIEDMNRERRAEGLPPRQMGMGRVPDFVADASLPMWGTLGRGRAMTQVGNHPDFLARLWGDEAPDVIHEALKRARAPGAIEEGARKVAHLRDIVADAPGALSPHFRSQVRGLAELFQSDRGRAALHILRRRFPDLDDFQLVEFMDRQAAETLLNLP